MSAKKFFIVMIALLTLSVAAAVGAIYNGTKFLSKKSLELSEKMAEKDAQVDVIQRIKSSSSNTKDLEQLKVLVNEVLPIDKRQGELVADFLYTATSEAGLPVSSISTISFSGNAKPDALSGAIKSKSVPEVYDYPFTIQLKSIPYTKLLDFLGQIEKNKRIITVDNIQLTPSATNPSDIESISLSLKTYLKPAGATK